MLFGQGDSAAPGVQQCRPLGFCWDPAHNGRICGCPFYFSLIHLAPRSLSLPLLSPMSSCTCILSLSHARVHHRLPHATRPDSVARYWPFLLCHQWPMLLLGQAVSLLPSSIHELNQGITLTSPDLCNVGVLAMDFALNG
jgi:hypothetical protein